MNLGILGGTFDPVHLGHLAIAREAASRLALDCVLFVPAGQPWLRGAAPEAAAPHRAAMLLAAVRGDPAFEVSTMEIDRPGPSYTAETLQEIRRERGEGVSLYFIVGADSLREFSRWREPNLILDLCTLVAVSRPGHPLGAARDLGELFPGDAARITVLDGPSIAVSSTEVRRRVAEGRSVRGMVPPAVEEYIEGHHLYQGEGDV